MSRAWLVLADGTSFEGRSCGAEGEASGELVFNTSLTGYQEILTDPSYRGQIVTMTATHIGNVGVNAEDVESARPQISGLVVRDYCPLPCNWRSRMPLHHYLQQHHIVAIEGVDTRAVTRHIRAAGAMPALLSSHDAELATLRARAAALPGMAGQELVTQVTCRQPYVWTEGRGAWGGACQSEPTPHRSGAVRPHLLVYDFGVKRNILRSLVDHGARVTVVPATTPAREVLAQRPDGILLSNGPGDPSVVDTVIPEIQALIGRVPIFGICMGHQLLARAVGARTFKLKFGHRGGNQPVSECATGQVQMTSQNHGFAVDAGSLPTTAEITHINLNDGTLEGFRCPEQRYMAVQFHPEANPGPHDADGLFAEFLHMCTRN